MQFTVKNIITAFLLILLIVSFPFLIFMALLHFHHDMGSLLKCKKDLTVSLFFLIQYLFFTWYLSSIRYVRY